jgi:hypothetical protein
MTLQLLQKNEVFSHRTLDIADTRHLYQPYSEITRDLDERVEERAKEVIERGGALIIKDDRGTGKSSLVNYVLLELGETFFPIFFRLILAENFETVCSDPSEFVRYLLSRTGTEVRKVAKISKKDQERYRKYLAQEVSYTEGRKDTLLGKIKSALSWIPALASTEFEVGGELETYVESALKEKVYNVDRIAAIRDLCAVLESRQRRPVLVFDDTDHFLQQGAIDHRPLIDAFFVKVVPMFTEFGCSVVLSAHNSYDDYETFRIAQKKYFDVVLKIPVVGIDGFMKIIERKIRAVSSGSEVKDFFDRAALDLIFKHAYLKKPKERMRDTMLVLQEAITAAVHAGSAKVTEHHAFYALFESGS